MTTGPLYRDRREAGQILAAHVKDEFGAADAVVLGLPRGGVPVACEVARALDAPLDVFVVRKLGVPQHPEIAMGAIAPGGVEILNAALVRQLGISCLEIAAIADRETEELQRREACYRGNRPQVDLRGRTVILVDDGLATGFSMRAAVDALRLDDVLRIIVAVPVGAAEACEQVAREVDALICPMEPEPFHAVGAWYYDFTPATDAEVCECLSAAEGDRWARHAMPRVPVSSMRV